MKLRALRRGKARREYDMHEVSRLYLEGVSLPAIAERLNITYAQANDDMRVIRRAWRRAQAANFDELRSRELTKIDHLEAVYWDAWFRSQRDQEETVTERRDGTTAVALARVRRRTGITGDFTALAGVQWCIERRIRLLGLDAPTRITVESVRAEAERIAAVTGFSVEEIIAEAQTIVNAAY